MLAPLAVAALLLAAGALAPAAAAVVPPGPLVLPLPLAERCGYAAGPVGLNCAAVGAEGSTGPCSAVEGGWHCPLSFAVVVDTSWWKNAGGATASVAGSCTGRGTFAWDGPTPHRRDEVRCEGAFFLPEGGCARLTFWLRVAFVGDDAPPDRQGGLGLSPCA